jgi:hypothetical protein
MHSLVWSSECSVSRMELERKQREVGEQIERLMAEVPANRYRRSGPEINAVFDR